MYPVFKARYISAEILFISKFRTGTHCYSIRDEKLKYPFTLLCGLPNLCSRKRSEICYFIGNQIVKVFKTSKQYCTVCKESRITTVQGH